MKYECGAPALHIDKGDQPDDDGRGGEINTYWCDAHARGTPLTLSEKT